MTRIEVETKLNEGRSWLLATMAELTDEQLHRPLTPSEHDPENLWSPLDHFAHLALIERNFIAMIRRHVRGDANPVGLLKDEKGEPRSREDIMATVHAMTDEFQQKHRDDSFSAVVALTADARADTLHLLAELSDDQLLEKLPGAPWSDGTIGGVIAVNADHGRMHWKWVKEAGLLNA